MENQGRINIGAFLGHMDAEYSYEVCMGMEKACRQTGSNLFIFPGMFSDAFYSHPQRYDYQINTVYGLVKKENIDILIISLGTIGRYLYTDDYQEFLRQYEGIPVILLEESLPGYSSISIDNDTGFRQCLEHLITVHGCRKICYVDGHRNNPDAVIRRNIYTEVMAQYHLPNGPEMIYEGNFRQDVSPQIRDLLQDHPDADAICFANDDMAKGSYQVLKDMKKTIGKDILITGFDDNPAAAALDPPLTTVRVNSFSIGFRSVLEALKQLRKQTLFEKKIPSLFVVRESCGCLGHPNLRAHFSGSEFSLNSLDRSVSVLTSYILEKNSNNHTTSRFPEGLKKILQLLIDVSFQLPEEAPLPSCREHLQFLEEEPLSQISLERFNDSIRRICKYLSSAISSDTRRLRLITTEREIIVFTNQRIQGILNQQNSLFKNATWILTHFTSDSLPIITETEKCISFLGDKLQQLGAEETFLLLYLDPVIYWGEEPYQSDQKLRMAMHITPEGSIDTSLTQFASVTDILNQNRSDEIPRCTRFVFPLYANEEHFGYLICTMDQSHFHFVNLATRGIGLTLKLMHLMRREKASQELLMQANRELTVRSQLDVLTNVYNRRGFFEHGISAIHNNPGSYGIIAYLDLNNLKQINDQFGHENGDFAIAAAANILKHSCRNGDIIARIGGDEFAFLSILPTDAVTEEQMRQRIVENAAHFNEVSSKPFYIEFSIGIMHFFCQDQNIESLLTQVDQRLYKDKQKKRKNVMKPL